MGTIIIEFVLLLIPSVEDHLSFGSIGKIYGLPITTDRSDAV
jgi:hypothetical protein